MKKSYNDGLYLRGNASGFYAPTGGPFNSDITTWKMLADRGEPAAPDALAVGRELTGFHSWAGLTGPSAALLVQNGWTDDLFPAPEALRVYRTFHGGARRADLAPARRPRASARHERPGPRTRAMQRQAADVLRRVPEGPGQGAAPRQRPRLHPDLPAASRRAGGASAPQNWERLHPKTVTHAPPRAAADELARRQPGHRHGDRPDRRRRQGVRDRPGRARQGARP